MNILVLVYYAGLENPSEGTMHENIEKSLTVSLRSQHSLMRLFFLAELFAYTFIVNSYNLISDYKCRH